MWCSLVLFGGFLIGIVYTGAICPFGYSSNYGRCYRYFSTKLSWTSASAFCRARNSGNLLSIHTNSLKHDVWSHTERTKDGELWVGADSKYTWLDGTRIPSDWYLKGEPNSDKENCVEVWASGGSRGTGLNDEECKYEQEFACQADGCYSIANCNEGSRCSWDSSYFSSDICDKCDTGYYSGGQGNGCIEEGEEKKKEEEKSWLNLGIILPATITPICFATAVVGFIIWYCKRRAGAEESGTSLNFACSCFHKHNNQNY